MFLTLLFIPIAVLCCTWLPLYYGYSIIYNLCVGNLTLMYTILKGIGFALVFAFIIPFIAQAFLVYFLDRKKINQPFKKMLPAILCFPLFMIIYAFSIFIGALSKPKWKQIRRSNYTSPELLENNIIPQEKIEISNEEKQQDKLDA